jgi:hypothetical protein
MYSMRAEWPEERESAAIARQERDVERFGERDVGGVVSRHVVPELPHAVNETGN